MKTYAVAIVGAGMISKSHIAAINNLPNAKCVAITDIIHEKAQAAAQKVNCPCFTDAKEMLEKVPEIDVCILSLPTYIHSDYVSLCAEYGKATLCEKPLEMTVEKAERIRSVVQKTGIIYMTAQVVRFWTGYREIKEMMKNGEFGDIYMSYFSRCSEPQKWGNDWLFDPVTGGGAMYDMLVHDIDFMNYLYGPAESVYTVATKSDTNCYNNVFASLIYSGGAKGVAETSFTMKTGYPFTMTAKIMGSKATAEYIYSAGYDINQRNGAIAVLKLFRDGKTPEIINVEQYDAYTKQLAYFLDCVDRGVQPDIVTLDQSVEVIRTIDAIRRSADTNSIIRLR